MADDEKDQRPRASVPDWQRSSNDTAATTTSASATASDDKLTVARRFLEDDQVKNASREKKESFLKDKGLSDAEVLELLGKPEPSETKTTPTPATTTTTTSSPAPTDTLAPSSHAPVVTYPEFLTKTQSAAPPPLVTTSRLLTTLQFSAALATLVVGSSRYIFAPMLEQLTASREDLHTTASSHLSDVIGLLEKSVSVVPPPTHKKSADGEADEEESDDDPSEMFHRDIGTQTVLPVPSAADAPKDPPHVAQATRLSALTRSLTELGDGIRSQSEGLSDVKSLVDVLRDDLDALTYRSPNSGTIDFTVGQDYGKTASTNQDEMRKVRDNIRRVKGVLLSARSFPSR